MIHLMFQSLQSRYAFPLLGCIWWVNTCIDKKRNENINDSTQQTNDLTATSDSIWWLARFALLVSFWLFCPKIFGGGRNLRMVLYHSMIANGTLGNPTLCKRICLNFLGAAFAPKPPGGISHYLIFLYLLW